MELVDLSGEVEDGQPVYPGWQPTRFWVSARHGNGAPLNRVMLVSEHGPTHVDSFNHFDRDNDTSVDQIPLERFYTSGIAVDFSDKSADEWISIEDIEAQLDHHDLAIEDGDTVLFHTGHRQRNYGLDDESKQAYMYEHTGLTGDAGDWLQEQGVSNMGIDAPTIEHASAWDTGEYPVHRMCAEHEVLHMENLANIDAVVGERFRFIAFPLKLKDGTGSPIRPVAVLEA